MRKISRIGILAAVVGIVMAITPAASAEMASPFDASDGCGVEVHYVRVGGDPFVQFAGHADISDCVPPMQA